MGNGRITWVMFYLKKGPERGLIFRTECRLRIVFVVAASAAVVVVAAAVVANAVSDFAVVVNHLSD